MYHRKRRTIFIVIGLALWFCCKKLDLSVDRRRGLNVVIV
jgi:hypothetical protein